MSTWVSRIEKKYDLGLKIVLCMVPHRVALVVALVVALPDHAHTEPTATAATKKQRNRASSSAAQDKQLNNHDTLRKKDRGERRKSGWEGDAQRLSSTTACGWGNDAQRLFRERGYHVFRPCTLPDRLLKEASDYTDSLAEKSRHLFKEAPKGDGYRFPKLGIKRTSVQDGFMNMWQESKLMHDIAVNAEIRTLVAELNGGKAAWPIQTKNCTL